MSTPNDMAECELRDEFGNPRHRCPVTRPRATIDSGGAPLNGTNVDQSVGKRTNDALPWVAMACILAGLALGVALMMRPVMDAMDAKTKAELRAEFAQELAEVRAEANQAGNDAAIWKNRVMKLEAEANARHR